MVPAKKELSRLLTQARLSKSDCVSLMTHIRVVLEQHPQKRDYPTLGLYCDWLLHHKIDRSIECYGMLEELTRILVLNKDAPPLRPPFSEPFLRLWGWRSCMSSCAAS